MGTTNALFLNQRLQESVGDWLRVTATTNVAANVAITSTTLNQYDGGRDNYFTDWWVYVEDFLNAGVERKIKNYYTANATALVYGANLTADANNASHFRFSRYSYSEAQRALNDAIRETYPILHRAIVNTSMVTNSNIYAYSLPANFVSGDVDQLEINTSVGGIDAVTWENVWDYEVTNAASWIELPHLYSDGHKMRITGHAPLSTVNVATDTIETNEERHIDLLLAYAKYKLYDQKGQPMSAEDIGRYDSAKAQAYAEYKRLLPKGRMTPPKKFQKVRDRTSSAYWPHFNY